MAEPGSVISVLDRRALVAGASVAAAIAVPAAILGEVVTEGSRADGPVFVFLLAVLAGFAVGGHLAARRAPTAPLANGAAAAVAAFALVQGAGLARRVTAGEALEPESMAFAALLACSAGLIGALVASRRRGPSPG